MLYETASSSHAVNYEMMLIIGMQKASGPPPPALIFLYSIRSSLTHIDALPVSAV